MSMTTTGWAALAAGESWHYVGSGGGEPAFGTDWANAAGDRNLAFRIREAGVVDIQGYIENTDAPNTPGSALFTLPTGYHPTSDTFQGFAIIETDSFSTDGYIAAPVNVSTTGVVSVSGIDSDPFGVAGPYVGVAQYVWIHGQLFLTPASAP